MGIYLDDVHFHRTLDGDDGKGDGKESPESSMLNKKVGMLLYHHRLASPIVISVGDQPRDTFSSTSVENELFFCLVCCHAFTKIYSA
jgi:hypothetical protein